MATELTEPCLPLSEKDKYIIFQTQMLDTEVQHYTLLDFMGFQGLSQQRESQRH